MESKLILKKSLSTKYLDIIEEYVIQLIQNDDNVKNYREVNISEAADPFHKIVVIDIDSMTYSNVVEDIKRLYPQDADRVFYASLFKYAPQEVRSLTAEWLDHRAKQLSEYYFTFSIIKLCNIPRPLGRVENEFKLNSYAVLTQLLYQNEKLKILEQNIQHLFALEEISIFSEFELYQTLELLVVKGQLDSYKNVLNEIRFLTMTSKEVKSISLLNKEEKRAILFDIKSRKGCFNRLICRIKISLHTYDPLPEYLSHSRSRRLRTLRGLKYHAACIDQLIFWIQILNQHPNYEVASKRAFLVCKILEGETAKHLDRFMRKRRQLGMKGPLTEYEYLEIQKNVDDKRLCNIIKYAFSINKDTKIKFK